MTGFLRIVYSAFTFAFLATSLQANSTIVPVIVDVEASGRGVVEITNLRTQPTLYNIEVLKWAVVTGSTNMKTQDYSSSAHQASNSIPAIQKNTTRISRQARHPVRTDFPTDRRGSPLRGEESRARHLHPRRHSAPCPASLCRAAKPWRAEIDLDHYNQRRHSHPTGHQLRQPTGHSRERRSASEPLPREHARLCQQQLGTCVGRILAGTAGAAA